MLLSCSSYAAMHLDRWRMCDDGADSLVQSGGTHPVSRAGRWKGYREAWITCINMRAAANYRPAAEGAFYLNLSPMWAAAAVTCWSGHLGLDLNNIAAGGRQLSFAGSQVNLGRVSQRTLELETNLRRSFHNHGEGSYKGLLLVERTY